MRKLTHYFLAIVVVTGFLSGCGGSDNHFILPISAGDTSGKYLYVNTAAATNSVEGFAINADGTLTTLPGSPFATGGSGTGGYYAANNIAIARTKKLLFASNTVDSTISVFTLNSGTGGLTPVGAPVASGGTMGVGGSLAVDAGENFLFVGNDTSQSISIFAIAANGALTVATGSPFIIGYASNGITLNAVGDLLYVASPAGTIHRIAVLSIGDGSLAHIAGSPFTEGDYVDSIALVSSALGLFAGAGGTLDSFSIAQTGTPTLLNSLDLGSGNVQAVTTARNGQLAIVSGGDSNSIAVVQVASNGTLTAVGGSPFTAADNVIGYAVATPNGSYLYATEATQIEAFSINSAGALTTISTYPRATRGFPTGLVIY